MEEKKNLKYTFVSFGISVSLIIIGSVFRLQHWPYSKLFLYAGASSIAIIHAFRFFIKKNKITTDYLKLIFAFLWCTGMLLRLQHLEYGHLIGLLTDGSFMLLTITYAYEYFLPFQEGASGSLSSRVLQVAFAGLILTGIFFKIVHLPFATLLIIAGVVCLFAWFVIDWIKEKKE